MRNLKGQKAKFWLGGAIILTAIILYKPILFEMELYKIINYLKYLV